MESKKKIGVILVISITIVIFGSYLFFFNKQREDLVTLGPENNGQEVIIEKGGEVIIELAENPSTGYAWEFATISEFAKLLENRYIQPEKQIPGRGGTRKIRLKISRNGTFSAKYIGPMGKVIENRFSLTFKVGQE